MNVGHQYNGRATTEMWGKARCVGVHLGEVYSVLAAAYSEVVADMMSQGLVVQP